MPLGFKVQSSRFEVSVPCRMLAVGCWRSDLPRHLDPRPQALLLPRLRLAVPLVPEHPLASHVLTIRALGKHLARAAWVWLDSLVSAIDVSPGGRPSPGTCARPSPPASTTPARAWPATRRALSTINSHTINYCLPGHPVHPHQELPARKRRPKQQNLQTFISVIVLDRNSQLGLHKPMKIPPFTQVNRARARARTQG